MCYSIEPRDRVYAKLYGFFSFAKNMGTHLSNKCSLKLLDSAKKSATDAWKLLQKDQFKKPSEVTGDLISKISDKITCASKSSKKKKYIHKII